MWQLGAEAKQFSHTSWKSAPSVTLLEVRSHAQAPQSVSPAALGLKCDPHGGTQPSRVYVSDSRRTAEVSQYSESCCCSGAWRKGPPGGTCSEVRTSKWCCRKLLSLSHLCIDCPSPWTVCFLFLKEHELRKRNFRGAQKHVSAWINQQAHRCVPTTVCLDRCQVSTVDRHSDHH